MRYLIFIALSLIASSSAMASQYLSEARFGLTLEDSSTQGFEQTPGSQMSLLVTRGTPVSGLNIGLFTFGANGAGEQGQFFRMASGLVTRYEINEDWACHFGLGYFASTTTWEENGQKARGNGLVYLGGWQRELYESKSFSVALGGFVAYYNGRANLTEGAAAVGISADHGTEKSLSRGIELSAFMPLQ